VVVGVTVAADVVAFAGANGVSHISAAGAGAARLGTGFWVTGRLV
jgi:hypothetical protein